MAFYLVQFNKTGYTGRGNNDTFLQIDCIAQNSLVYHYSKVTRKITELSKVYHFLGQIIINDFTVFVYRQGLARKPRLALS
jgi:hypothetical protein